MSLFNRKKTYRPPSRDRFADRLIRLTIRLLVLLSISAMLRLVGWLAYQLHGFTYRSDYFSVREIIVSGCESRMEHRFKRDIRAMLDEDDNLLRLDTERVRLKLESHPKVRSVNVEKVYPSLLIVEVQTREIVAMVLNDPLLGIDRQGVITAAFSVRHPMAVRYPFLSGLDCGGKQPGDSLNSESLTKMLGLLLSIKNGSPHLYSQVSELHSDEDSNLTLLVEGGTAVRLGSEDPIEKMPVLDVFIRKMGSLDKFAYVDLRFNPVPFMTKKETARQKILSQEVGKTP